MPRNLSGDAQGWRERAAPCKPWWNHAVHRRVNLTETNQKTIEGLAASRDAASFVQGQKSARFRKRPLQLLSEIATLLTMTFEPGSASRVNLSVTIPLVIA